MSESRLFLIDAHALCYRAFFAIKSLSTSYGQPTNAVYGFINTLRKILREYQPEYMAICFDVGKKTKRQERFAEYKIHRPSMPDSLISQIPIIKEAVLAYNLPIYELEGFEADDVIATIATKTYKDQLETVIVSGDKDMIQLVNDKVKLFSIRKDSILNYDETKQYLGVDPQKVTDYLGLAGDSTDNIPGVKGIGEVTARELIEEFGTIENIFANIENIKSKSIKEKLKEQKDQALFSKELATLDTNVPITFTLDSLKVEAPNQQRLFELFQKLEFRKLAEELNVPQQKEEAVTTKKITTKNEFEALIAKIEKKGKFAFLLDIPDEEQGMLFGGLALSLGEKESYYISAEKINFLKIVFDNNRILKITFNMKECLKVLSKDNIAVRENIFDVMLAGYLVSPSQSSFDLEALSWMYLKASASVGDESGVKAKRLFDLFDILHHELQQKSLLKLYEEVEIPLAYVLFRMEEEGVSLDEELLKKLSKESERKIENLVRELYQMAGMEFNLNSPKQLSQVLFEKLKLPAVKKTKTGLSTDEGVLIKLSKAHPLPALILEYRQLAKLKSTYIDALPRLVDSKTGRLHATFNQAGTETGRLSSNNPNLQNIPIRTELGREIRRAFITKDKNYVMISADYSQIELRILAHLSQDKNLIKAFEQGQDIHRYTAALIFDVKEDKVTNQMRDSAKRINFGIIYGMSAFGLAKDLEISQEEGQEFINKYFMRYPNVKKFMENEIKNAEERGFVLTLLNRRRYLPEIKSSNMAIRQLAQRQAINTPVQGSAADLIKLAMINIQEILEKKSLHSKMIITVHDELVFDVFEKEQEEMVSLIRHQMEHPLSLSVPIKVSIKVGKNWLEMTET